MSVFCDIGNGCPNLATANNALSSLYNPIVVTYGSKYDAVAKSLTWGKGVFNDWDIKLLPVNKLSCNNVGLYERLNSLSLTWQITFCWYIVTSFWKDILKLGGVGDGIF